MALFVSSNLRAYQAIKISATVSTAIKTAKEIQYIIHLPVQVGGVY